jgi:phosphatidylglycerol:prolipoprotein diacylglycerol transferase
MEFQSPGAILFKLGPLTIRWYGIMVASGFLAATYAASRLAKGRNIDVDKIVNLALACFIGGVIGARLYYVALSWSYFGGHPSEILFSPSEGFSIRGLSIHGGIFGALIVGVIYCAKAKLPFLKCCDLVSSSLPLGQAIGRLGNFFNSEAFGTPVAPQFPLRLFIPPEARPSKFSNASYFHPTFLYEMIWDLGLFFLLYFVAAPRLQKFPGLTFFLYIGGYSLGRLLIEPIRSDSINMPGMAIPAPSLISAALIFVAMIGSGFVFYKNWRSGASS